MTCRENGPLIRVAAASRAVAVAPMPTGRSVAPLADVADRQRRDRPPRPLQERAKTNHWPQPVQRARANPKQRMPHSR